MHPHSPPFLPLALFAAALSVLPLTSTSLRAGESTEQPHLIRVLTYNIHHGEGVDGKLDLERIAAVITQAKADLVALQEVDKGVARTQGRDLPNELATLTGMRAIFANNFTFQGGEYGNAILTRFPVHRWTNTHLDMLREGEQRGVLQVVVDLPSTRRLLFMNTHIDYRRDDAERLRNVAQFQEIIRGYGDLPIVLCGDFNDSPRSRVYRAMGKRFEDTWTLVGEGKGFTYSSTQPRSRIDYIWLKGRASSPQPPPATSSPSALPKPVRAQVLQSEASDHLPLLVEFEIP